MWAMMRLMIKSALFMVATVLAAGAARADDAPSAVRSALVAATQALLDALASEAVASIHPLPKGFSGRIEVHNPHVRSYGDSAVIGCEA
jgi:hypothetical protein